MLNWGRQIFQAKKPVENYMSFERWGIYKVGLWRREGGEVGDLNFSINKN